MTSPRFGLGRPADRGATLVEVLIAIGLSTALATVLLAFVMSASRVAEDTQRVSGVNEQSRLVLERLTRELRQANEVMLWRMRDADDEVVLRFRADFDGTLSSDADDPEVLTYRWSLPSGQLTIAAEGASEVLADHISDFDIRFFSSLWEYDGTPHDGNPTTWLELDASAPEGDDDQRPDPQELRLVDLVKVSMTVRDRGHEQTYIAEVNLRNQNQN